MATGGDDCDGTERHDAPLALTEEDIPGAVLAEPFESHTVTELRWWLLCRGITVPTSWKKAQVVKRYGIVLRDSCILCIYDLSDSIIKYY